MIIDNSYLENKALNQSLLKKILIHPSLFLKRLQEQEGSEVPDDDEPSENIMIGDACDLILTQGEHHFYEQFVVTDLVKPTGQVGDYAWHLYTTGSPELAYAKTGAKISHDVLKTKFQKDGQEYYDFLCNNRGKKVITSEQFMKVQSVVDSLRYNDFVKHYFTQPEGVENIYQVELNFTYDGEACKGLMDLVHINHDKKLIFPVDLKVTESPTDNWEWIFWKMGYYFQASFYSYGLHENPPDKIKELLDKGYSIAPFSFVVESFKYPGSPVEYVCDSAILLMGEQGGFKGDKYYDGFAEAIKRYKWHVETGVWHYPMHVHQNGGKKWLKL
jgi:hypothetical protein